jgi:hypothetical protein
MWLGGYRGSPQSARFGAVRRNLLSVVVLSAFAIFLGDQLTSLVSKQKYETSLRKVLTTAAKGHTGAYLVDPDSRTREADGCRGSLSHALPVHAGGGWRSRTTVASAAWNQGVGIRGSFGPNKRCIQVRISVHQ